MEIAVHLNQWKDCLFCKRTDSLRRRFLSQALGSRIYSPSILLPATLNFLHVTRSNNAVEIGANLIFPLSVYSCIASSLFFIRKREHIKDILIRLIRVAEAVEVVDDDIKREIQRTSKVCQQVFKWFPMYAIAASGSGIVQALVTGRAEPRFWPWFDGILGEVCAALVNVSFGNFISTPAFGFVSLVSTLNLSSTALFRAIGGMYSRVSDHKSAATVVALHAELCSAVSEMSSLLSGFITHYLLGLLGAPALCTFIAVAGFWSPYTLVCVPYMMLYFAMCEIGQRLEDTSDGVRDSVYEGLWLDLPPDTRRELLTVMARTARPEHISVMALGHLNNSTAKDTLSSWFSFLNLMLKFL